MEYEKKLLENTEYADDIDMLIHILRQMRDYVSEEGACVTTAIPDPSCHCKHWPEIGCDALIDALEWKYMGGPRIEVPNEYLTEY